MCYKNSILIVSVSALMASCSFVGLERAPVETRQTTNGASPNGVSSSGSSASASASSAVKAPAAGAENAGKPGYHTVAAGETVYSIGRTYDANPKDIIAWNGLANPNTIEVGQVLRVQSADGKPAATATAVSPSPATASTSASSSTAPVTPNLNPNFNPSPASQGSETIVWIWPALGTLGSKFDGVKSKGIDVLNVAGTAIYAAAEGTVAIASPQRGYGNLVVIKHSDSLLSAYAHNQKLFVKEGQYVRRGQKIADMGAIDADRSKLHFQIRKDTKPVDPLKYLPAR